MTLCYAACCTNISKPSKCTHLHPFHTCVMPLGITRGSSSTSKVALHPQPAAAAQPLAPSPGIAQETANTECAGWFAARQRRRRPIESSRRNCCSHMLAKQLAGPLPEERCCAGCIKHATAANTLHCSALCWLPISPLPVPYCTSQFHALCCMLCTELHAAHAAAGGAPVWPPSSSSCSCTRCGLLSTPKR
jgi:hypothetical protein